MTRYTNRVIYTITISHGMPWCLLLSLHRFYFIKFWTVRSVQYAGFCITPHLPRNGEYVVKWCQLLYQRIITTMFKSWSNPGPLSQTYRVRSLQIWVVMNSMKTWKRYCLFDKKKETLNLNPSKQFIKTKLKKICKWVFIHGHLTFFKGQFGTCNFFL